MPSKGVTNEAGFGTIPDPWVEEEKMRARYQTNPKIAALGLILSLALILGAQEAESRPAVTLDKATEHVPALNIEPAGTEKAVEVSLDLLSC